MVEDFTFEILVLLWTVVYRWRSFGQGFSALFAHLGLVLVMFDGKSNGGVSTPYHFNMSPMSESFADLAVHLHVSLQASLHQILTPSTSWAGL